MYPRPLHLLSTVPRDVHSLTQGLTQAGTSAEHWISRSLKGIAFQFDNDDFQNFTVESSTEGKTRGNDAVRWSFAFDRKRKQRPGYQDRLSSVCTSLWRYTSLGQFKVRLVIVLLYLISTSRQMKCSWQNIEKNLATVAWLILQFNHSFGLSQTAMFVVLCKLWSFWVGVCLWKEA